MQKSIPSLSSKKLVLIKGKPRMGLKEGKKEKDNKKKNISANLVSRQSPYQLVQILQSLTDRQKAALREMGFGCMVDFSIDYLPMSLALVLVDRFDADKCEMMVGEKLMNITKKDVHEILGFPMGNREVKSLRRAGVVQNDLVNTWKLRFPMPKTGSQLIKLKDVKEKIKGEPEGGSLFKIDILLSIVTVMAEGIKCGTINQRVLGSINDINDIKDMDWCGYVIDCLKRSKDKWSNGSWYTGPLTFLVVWYAQHISKKQKGNPAILHWTTKELKSIEQMVLSGAKFDEGTQYPKPLSIDYPDKVPPANTLGDGDGDPENNNETNFDERESTKDEKASDVEFYYQTIQDPEERKQVFCHGIKEACDNLHKAMKSGLADFLGDPDVIGQINIFMKKQLKDLEQTIDEEFGVDNDDKAKMDDATDVMMVEDEVPEMNRDDVDAPKTDVDAATGIHDDVILEMDTRSKTKVGDRITQEFRKLPAGHHSQEDKLEVLHALDRTLKDIEDLQCPREEEDEMANAPGVKMDEDETSDVSGIEMENGYNRVGKLDWRSLLVLAVTATNMLAETATNL